MPAEKNITEQNEQVTVDTTELNKKLAENQTENFFKKADGSFKWLNIGGSVAAAVAIGFGIKFLVKKFTK